MSQQPEFNLKQPVDLTLEGIEAAKAHIVLDSQGYLPDRFLNRQQRIKVDPRIERVGIHAVRVSTGERFGFSSYQTHFRTAAHTGTIDSFQIYDPGEGEDWEATLNGHPDEPSQDELAIFASGINFYLQRVQARLKHIAGDPARS